MYQLRVEMHHKRRIEMADSKVIVIFTLITKYIVFIKSPKNHVNIIKRLKPYTLLFFWFRTICGNATVASIDNEANPKIVP